jgi:hypothetical protein
MTTLSKALESIAAKAKKRVDETGSLHGFSANYRDLSGSGVTALSISTIATDDGAAILTYTLDRDNAAGATTKGEQDSPAHMIEELMEFLNGLRRARQRKAAAPLDAHARRTGVPGY